LIQRFWRRSQKCKKTKQKKKQKNKTNKQTNKKNPERRTGGQTGDGQRAIRKAHNSSRAFSLGDLITIVRIVMIAMRKHLNLEKKIKYVPASTSIHRSKQHR
jgi:hypothetical protein